jgi:hypothetical protein
VQAPKLTKTWTIISNQRIFEGRPGGWDERVRQRSRLLLLIKDTLVALGWRPIRSMAAVNHSNPWNGHGVSGGAGPGPGDMWGGWTQVCYDTANHPDWDIKPADWVPGSPGHWQYYYCSWCNLSGGLEGVYTHNCQIHSWIILAPPLSSGSHYQILIDWASDNNQIYEGGWHQFHVSATGFTGGGERTVAPTAGANWSWVNQQWGGSTWGTAGAANYDYTVHGMISNDGKQTRLLSCFNGLVDWTFTLDVLDKPVPSSAAWSDPTVISFFSSGNTTRYYLYPLGYGRCNDGAPFYTRWSDGSTSALYATSEGYGGATFGEDLPCPNEFTGAWEVQPVALYSFGTTGKLGRVGTLTDSWWAPTRIIDGTLLATQDSRRLAVFNNMALPWNTNAAPLFGELGQGT